MERSCHLDTITNICDSREEVKMSTLTGVRKKLAPTLRDDFAGLKASVEKANAGVVQRAGELDQTPAIS